MTYGGGQLRKAASGTKHRKNCPRCHKPKHSGRCKSAPRKDPDAHAEQLLQEWRAEHEARLVDERESARPPREDGRCSEAGCPYQATVAGRCRQHYQEQHAEVSLYASSLGKQWVQTR